MSHTAGHVIQQRTKTELIFCPHHSRKVQWWGMAAIQSPPVQSMYPALMQDVSEILIVPARGWNRLQCAVKISWETEHLALYYRDISWIFLITCIWKVIYGLLSLHEASSEITGYLLRWWLHYYITCVLPFYNKFYIHLYMENQNWTCPIYLVGSVRAYNILQCYDL